MHNIQIQFYEHRNIVRKSSRQWQRNEKKQEKVLSNNHNFV